MLGKQNLLRAAAWTLCAWGCSEGTSSHGVPDLQADARVVDSGGAEASNGSGGAGGAGGFTGLSGASATDARAQGGVPPCTACGGTAGAGGGIPEAGSGSGGRDPDAGSDASATPDAADASPTCDPHGAAGTTFVDSTASWGLAAVVGNRIVSADLDGDGYPDLVIHATGSNDRETIGTPPKLVWVLMNRPNGSGGRAFIDATEDSGLFQIRGGSTTQYRSAQLASLGDVDDDGDLDVFSGTYVDPMSPATDTGDRSEILLNDGTGRFSLAPASDPHPAPTDSWPTTGATMTDVDRDGKLDLFVGFWYRAYGTAEDGFQAQLYRGNGDGTFTTITSQAGLTLSNTGFDQGLNNRPSYGVTSCDVDGDGSPELLLSAYGRQWNLLYQNDGAAHFTEVGRTSGYAADDDLDYGDNQSFACYCSTVNPTAADCAGVAAPRILCLASSNWVPGIDDRPWRLGGNNFSTYCGDLNGDGKLDAYTANVRHWYVGQSSDSSEILYNTTQGRTITFDRPGNAVTGAIWPHATADWNEGALMVAGGDLDNDGREDLVVAASDYPGSFGLVFHQKADGTFEEVGAEWGLHHPCMSGLTIADFDRDGDLDVVVGSGRGRDCALTWPTSEVHFYENTGASAQRWIQLKLVGDGTTANRSAFGARVTLSAGGLAQTKERDGSYGHMSMQNDTILSFGLGQCTQPNDVTVRWPDQALTTQTFSGLQAGKRYELRMGDGTAREVP